MRHEDRHKVGPGEGSMIKQETVPDAVADPRPERDGTDRVPSGDRVTVDPVRADEEVVAPTSAEGSDPKRRTSFGNDPGRQGTN
jgi:hypothetical protein